MWDWKDVITLLILIRFTVDSQQRITNYEYKRDFTFKLPADTNLPAHIQQDLDVHGPEIPRLNVTVSKVQEDFNLTLLAVPISFMKERGNCNGTVSETIIHGTIMDIHQYMNTWPVQKTDEGQSVTFSFSFIFSGCYYVLMTNDKRESWQMNLGLFETPYPYLKRKIENIEPKISPAESGADNMHLDAVITIPLSCFHVTVKVYEFPKTLVVNDDSIALFNKEVGSGLIRPSEECYLIQGGVKEGCNNIDPDEDFMFESNLLDENGKVHLEWKRLSPGVGAYFFKTKMDPGKCHQNDTFGSDVKLWRLLSEDILYPLDRKNWRNDSLEAGYSIVDILFYLAVIVLSIASAAVLTFFITKSCRKKKELKEKLRVDGLQPLTQLIDAGKLKHILLVYARGDDQFMKEMRDLRHRLKQECECKVHDVYSSREYSTIAELGAHEWVKKLLIEGSKVVWVDTPQLRSYFNDKQMQNASTDCRDAAIPFAIELTTGLFQNPTTQYRCHFVVRVEGFEVEDGCDDDPLRVVSPHARYYIPRNFSRLCGDITTTLVSPKYKKNLEV